MNFFKGLKRAFGLNDENDDADYLDGNAGQAIVNPFRKNEAASDDSEPHYRPVDITGDDKAGDSATTVPPEVLDTLVDIVNGNLSPMVAKHLDVEAEKAELRQALGERFTQFVDAIGRNAIADARQRWDRQRDDLVEKLKAADAAATGASQRIDEVKQKLATCEAQRKATNARLTDLQNKVETLEAEREQFDLENKSLLNKIKVMQVRGEATDDDDALAQKVVALTAELEALRDKQTAQPAELAALEEEYKNKMAITNELINGLRSEAADQAARAHDLQQQVDTLTAQLDEANDNLAIANEIQEQIERVEQTITHKNEEIAQLQATIKQLQESNKDDALRQMVQQLERDKNELETKLEQSQRDEQERAKTRKRRDVETANHIDSLKEQLAGAARINEQLHNEARQLNHLIDNLNKKIEQLTQEKEEKATRDENANHSTPAEQPATNETLQPEVKPEPKPTPEPESEPTPEPETEPEPAVAIPIDDIDDIDWLSPQPPKKPEPEPQPEPKPAPEPPSSRQMSLF